MSEGSGKCPGGFSKILGSVPGPATQLFQYLNCIKKGQRGYGMGLVGSESPRGVWKGPEMVRDQSEYCALCDRSQSFDLSVTGHRVLIAL